MILMKDFADGRGVNPDTIATYIRRHPELFDGHTQKSSNKLLLDDEAVELLNKVYPAPAPEEIWTPAAKRKYDNLLEKYTEVLEDRDDYKTKYFETELKHRALDTTFQLQLAEKLDEAVSEATKQLSTELELAAESADAAKQEAEEQRNRADAAESELAAMKSEVEKYRNLSKFKKWLLGIE